MEIIRIATTATNAALINPPREAAIIASKIMSYEVSGAEFAKTYKQGVWSGTSSFYKFKGNTFPAGFVDLLRLTLQNEGYVVHVARKALLEPLGPELPIVSDFPPDPRYDYQAETMRRLIKRGRMIAQIATGGGKSLVAKLCYKRIGRMTLFLTTRGVLMHQMKESFEEIGENVGVIGDGILKVKKGINVGMVQTLASMLKDPKRSERTKQILNMFEFVILEEAHEASGNSYYEILSHCKNAHYRLALTATPFMRSNDEDNMRLRACVGEVGIKVSERTLISRGILATPYFKYVDVAKPNGLFKTTSWQAAYRIGIVENEKRNEIIGKEVKRATFYGLKSIVLVQHKVHGENIQKILTNADVKCLFVYGEHSQEERKAAFDKLKSGEINCLIGSTIIDVGVDIPAVSFVVLAGGGKAEVALRQRIGRGLREKRGSANVTFILDFLDKHNKHTKQHADSRKKIVEMTPGFVENILLPTQDFNYRLIQNG
jgi:superfamily II DNA or RNA helicase